MFDIVIPEFLLGDSQPTRLSELLDKYDEQFDSDTRSIEGYDISDEKLEKMLERCLKENRTLFDILGYYPDDLDEDDEI